MAEKPWLWFFYNMSFRTRKGYLLLIWGLVMEENSHTADFKLLDALAIRDTQLGTAYCDVG